MRKTIAFTALVLVLLLALCGCTQPRVLTSDRLEVQVKGENTKKLTLTFTGPDLGVYPAKVSGDLEEDAVFAIAKNETKDGATVVQLTGVSQGSSSLAVAYSRGDEVYAVANALVTVDEKLKLSISGASVIGDERFESLGETVPEGSEITKEDGSSKLIKLANADSPWYVETYDQEILKVEEYGYVEEEEDYEFFVSALTTGNGSVYLVNDSLLQRICLDFEVSNVIEGESQSLNLVLTNSATVAFSEKESEKYIAKEAESLKTAKSFSSNVYIPSSAILKGCGIEAGYLDISLKMGDNTLECLVLKDVSLKEELEAIGSKLTVVENDSFVSNGIEVNLFMLGDYALAVWEQYGLMYELYILEVTDIGEAGDIVEAFLSDTAL